MIKLNLAIYFLILFTSINSQLGRNRNLYENDICKPGDSGWTCRRLSNCPTGKQAIRRGQWPEICSFDGLEPIVCCEPEQTENPAPPPRPTTPQRPPPQENRPVVQPVSSQFPSGVSNRNSKAKQMCEKYAAHVYRYELPPVLLAATVEEEKPEKYDECASTGQPLVIGGKDAIPKEFPHMAQIGYGESPRVAWLCGGSLISESFVLSAAHCTKPSNRGPAKWARLGDLNTATDEDDARTVIARISDRYDHPDYDSIKLYNDIALYKLERPVELNHYLRPLCLDVGDKSFNKAIATGWGHTEWGGRGSAHLKKVSLNIVNARTCNKSYERNIGRQLPYGIDGTSMMCAGDEVGKDTCQGDSGGPLQILLDTPYCMYAQVGITSFGKECGSNYPGVYTKVSNYIRWIESIVWP